MLDLKITGGTIVDGTGRPAFRGDVGIREGRVVAVGEVGEDARETVDATGRIVSPGFVDVHTHYDVQVFWDPKLSPSCFHGVTTVLAGMCGFSIAPLSAQAAGYIRPMLARVEGMPLETLEVALSWDWTSFGDYLGRLDGKIGLNAGFFAGHSAIRRVVMGERAVGEKATSEELEQMKALLAESLEQGALGFSSSISTTHNDGDGNPVPSRFADAHEIVELGRVVRDYPGTGLELLPGMEFDEDTTKLITDFSVAGNRAVNWNALLVDGRADDAERAARQLAITTHAREHGGEVIALTLPVQPAMYMNLATGMVFDSIPGMWREIFKWPLAERKARLRDPALRRQLAEDATMMPPESMLAWVGDIGNYRVTGITAEKNKAHDGRLVRDIAAEQGREPIDVMLDLALDDDLMTIFCPNVGGADDASIALRGKLWRDDRTLIGASDAGAHIDMVDAFSYATMVLQQGVREHGVVSLEEAIYQMTDRPARYMGLIDRGRIEPGYHADLVVFDKESVGRGPTYFRYDVPGDQFRTYADAKGVDHVFVNGVQIVRNGEHTGALPGTVLRSGRDTRTVALDELHEGRTAELAPAE